jgi:pilus assembly protein CpaC
VSREEAERPSIANHHRVMLFALASALAVRGVHASAQTPTVIGRGSPPVASNQPQSPYPATRPSALPPAQQPAQQQPAAQPSVAAEVRRPILMTRPPANDHGDHVELAGDFSYDTPTNLSTHIVTGRSIFIDTKHRLARVYVTNPAILDSYTSSPNQVVVTAKQPGMSTLILWDETGESKTYQISSDLNVEMLSDSIHQSMPNESVHVQANETRVILTGTVGTAAMADTAVKMAALYTKDVMNSLVINSASVKQVRLDVRMVEVDRSKMSSFAFNFFSAGGNNLGSTSTNQYTSTMSVAQGGTTGGKTVTLGNPLNFSLYSSKLNIGMTLQDLETMQVLQILAEPTIVAMSGEKGNFLAGGEFPFPVVQGSSTGGTTISIQFRPYGVKLEFTPTVNPDGTIELKVAPEVSALDYTNAVNISGYTIPALSTRRAETDVVVKSGQTFAISGLLDRRTTDLYSKTPGIASVPILGQLFKSKGVTHSDNELIVIVTPTILDPVTSNTPIVEPKTTIPLIDRQQFDKALPKGAGVKQQ